MINKFNTKQYIQIASYTLVGLIFIIILWGYFAPLSTLAVANGKIIVSGENKPIQYLDNGIVKKIYVQNGDSVKQNDILIKLDDTQLKSQYNVMLQNITELKLKRDRLYAQKDNLKVVKYSFDIKDYNVTNIQNIKHLQNYIFRSRNELKNSQINIIKKKNKALKDQIKGINEAIKNKLSYIASVDEEIKELQSLYDDKLIDKTKLRELKRKKILLDSDLSDLKIQKASLKVNITQNEEEIIKIKKEFISKVLDELKDTLTKIDNLQEQLIAIKDRLDHTIVRSPLDGVVDNLQIFNIGAVLTSGQIIMYIVPKSTELIVEANLDITDIDSVMVGQKADITFSAFNTRMTFAIEGEVSYISADRKVDKNSNKPYYKVDIAITKKGKEDIKKNNFILKVGMPATVMIKTGSRTMLSYLLKPILDMKVRAFNEE